MPRTRLLRRLLISMAGGLLCLTGIVLLVLPGPGLLLVLGGLVLLATEYPRLQRLVAPVRTQAMRAARESVSSRPRIAGSLLCGVALIGAGVAWAVTPWLPLGGITTGSSLVLSGILLIALLGYSYRDNVVMAGRGRPGGRRGESSARPATRETTESGHAAPPTGYDRF